MKKEQEQERERLGLIGGDLGTQGKQEELNDACVNELRSCGRQMKALNQLILLNRLRDHTPNSDKTYPGSLSGQGLSHAFMMFPS